MKESISKKKILLIGGRYASPVSANSICCQNIAEFFAKQGNHVYMLARGYEYNGQVEKIHGVTVYKEYGDHYGAIINKYLNKRGFISRLEFLIIRILYYLKSFIYYPLSSLNDRNHLYRRAIEIIEKNSIDTVVSMYRPFESILVALMLKKKYGSELKVVTYHLDLLFSHKNTSSLIVKYKNFRMKKFADDEQKTVDKILLPSSARHIDSKKVEYVDFPLYIAGETDIDLINDIQCFSNDIINITIVGSLDSINRNIDYICQVIDSLPLCCGKEVALHIWGSITGLSIENYKHTIYHGMANIKDVPQILKSSDFLLNIGNKITFNMIPSKIFQIFAAKRPVIFNVPTKEDITIPYFKKFGHTCFVNEFNHAFDDDINKVAMFICEFYRKEIFVDDDLFIRSTPEYICNKILE